MHEPVIMIAADGHTYDKLAMEQNLQQHNSSPVAGSVLQHKRLIPNVIFKNVIAQQQQQLLLLTHMQWPAVPYKCLQERVWVMSRTGYGSGA